MPQFVVLLFILCWHRLHRKKKNTEDMKQMQEAQERADDALPGNPVAHDGRTKAEKAFDAAQEKRVRSCDAWSSSVSLSIVFTCSCVL